MESWRKVWRDGFVPSLSTAGLEAIAHALRDDDPRLTQGSTTTPPPLMCVQDWPCEAADALGLCGVVEHGGFGEATVGEVEEFFTRACFDADQRLGESAACRWYLNWFDGTPRDEMRRELLAEVERALTERSDTVREHGDKYPKGSVVVKVPRSDFPRPFSENSAYDEMDEPYQRVSDYNLVIVPSGVVNSQNDKYNRIDYSFVYSGKSGKCYSWARYYAGSYFEPGLEVGGEKVLVDCLPDKKDYHKPPRAVNVYASTAGVVWLVLNAVIGLSSDAYGPNAERLVSLDDAPFATYFDMLDEFPPDSLVDRIRDRLRLFFGLSEGV